jgi:3D (Asp-Asp-Asp) domain-containing protein
MTIKEKLMKERPELDEDYFKMHCPDEEGLTPSKKCMCVGKKQNRYLTGLKPVSHICDDCWNQPYGLSLWQILLIVACVVTLVVSLIFVDLHIFAAEPSTNNVNIPVVDTMEHVKESVPEEPVETTVVETVEETTVETVVETATEIVETVTEPEVIVPTVDISKGKRMTLVATAYCGENYPHICNDGDSSKTATGTKPTAGRTIAVDPRMIPYGSKVIINGVTYIAEDCGGAIKSNRIDIFFDTHQEALQWGRRTVEAIVITENS